MSACRRAWRGFPPRQAETRGRELLARVGLEERLEHKPYELSGGEQQRVAIARALINEPELLLADEPTGNLDSHTGGEIIELLKNLRAEKQMTLVIATHDAKVAAHAERVVELVDGQIQAWKTEYWSAGVVELCSQYPMTFINQRCIISMSRELLGDALSNRRNELGQGRAVAGSGGFSGGAPGIGWWRSPVAVASVELRPKNRAIATRASRPPPTVCVPGCGTGHDVRECAQAGFDAFGFDIAPSAIRLATEKTQSRRPHGEIPACRFSCATSRRLNSTGCLNTRCSAPFNPGTRRLCPRRPALAETGRPISGGELS